MPVAVAVPDAVSLVTDRSLRPFLAPNFDPADYLNATLPSWSSSASSAPKPVPQQQPQATALAALASQTQTVLSQLGAHLTRLSATLTTMTDEILRVGSRLAYEVEVLQGDVSTFAEVLTEGLAKDIQRFVPGGIQLDPSTPVVSGAIEAEDQAVTAPLPSTDTPDFVRQLHVLALVRSRLESVVKVFGDAMEWAIPPSEVSIKSSFISVSSPAPGADQETREARGREFAEHTRSAIMELINADVGDDGLENALRRVQALRETAIVFDGTREEKPRSKFLDALSKIVEDARKPRLGESHGYQLRADP